MHILSRMRNRLWSVFPEIIGLDLVSLASDGDRRERTAARKKVRYNFVLS
ncbi:MAG: hypothetical protein OEV06_12390 [Anaerolineae bacterium]|nr:hypothetical protein [Anaerolineae bacterium]